MSIMLMSRLFRIQFGSANRKMVAIRLADFADDDGRGIWPTVARLARETEISDRTVQRILKDMVEEGILVVVREGGGRPGQATRYDFDMKALARLESGDNNAEKVAEMSENPMGDTVSPVTNEAETGDKSDIEGCHGVTQTVIEPLNKPSIEREVRDSVPDEENSVDAGCVDDPTKFERRVKKIAHDTQWHGWAKSPTAWAISQFAKLSDAERAEAEEKAMAYAKHCGKKVVPLGVYFRDRKWTDLPLSVLQAVDAEKAREQGIRKVAAPFGKLWGAYRMAELLGGAKPRTRPSAFIETMIKQGGDTGERYRREWLAKAGYPVVVAMHEQCQNRNGYSVDDLYRPLAEDMEQVRTGSDLWNDWRDLHERMGWLWFDEGSLPEWVWFPKGGVNGLTEFEAKLAEVKKDAGL